MARDEWLGKPRWRGRGTRPERGDYGEEWRQRRRRRFGPKGQREAPSWRWGTPGWRTLAREGWRQPHGLEDREGRRERRRRGAECGYEYPYRARRRRWGRETTPRYGSPEWLGQRGYGREYHGWYGRDYGR